MDYIRQEKIFNPSKHAKPCAVIGCGGIGSFVALGLAKLGIRQLSLYDDDKIEFHNLPNQMFRVGLKGEKLKVEEVREICQLFSDDIIIDTHQKKVGGFEIYRPNSVVISGVDSMESRANIWKSVKYNPSVDFYIDARIGGQSIRIQAVRPLIKAEVEAYEKTLYADEKAEELGCTDRSIIDVGFSVAALVVRLVRGFLTGEGVPPLIILSMKDLSIQKVETK